VALAATAALSPKKETEAVVTLYRRAAAKRILYPTYRLAHEAIDSLRAIGTDEAVTASRRSSPARPVVHKKVPGDEIPRPPEHLKDQGERSEEVLQRARRSADRSLRDEASASSRDA